MLMKKALFLFLTSWLLLYVLLSISYTSLLNPFQWIISFQSYSQPIKNLGVILAAPVSVYLCFIVGYTWDGLDRIILKIESLLGINKS